ncbi:MULTISPECIES: ATP-dependent nuclease [Klebsiella pneumoniae complex]|uniref:ATP-dependent nuclease n=1 Tax=Klebsiella pneumoniae complex TaxID=3390273 RepID=UPI00058EC20C|nr:MULTISPECIES: ATP-binding protein [Klebsiella]HBS2774301.1 AAA family ATPase [Klebsiella quasipneumoniae subsp. similipneumoniae]HCD1356279.1 AAA family ATPase [Klebsiella pneumoniae subsp. pneumoniae]ANK24883.1 ATP-dependent endonuclease [Klebsiella pneumoniae]EIX9325043.1 AAA family ATPase [Klebsiella pneumoniae]ELA2523724.1 AAA family ATPase [Klebsiella pneumoniae]
MVRVCKVEIQNFRSIRLLTWQPSPGLNCLIGPGDSGKTTILDAIDLCLGARRNVSFSDTDFFGLDVTQPISITLTLGSLPDALKAMETYGNYLQAFNSVTGQVQEEPQLGLETVLCLRLSVDSELEPNWTLVSQRAEALGQERNLAWKDRLLIAPARLGTYASSNLSWARGSVLNRLTEERPNMGAELSSAARQARTSFGGQATVQLSATLDVVTQKANELGVPVGGRAQALLDAHAVSIGDGAIALHNAAGVPLRSLGTGSSRLLVAGMQRAAAQRASVALVDEVEYGLEPHRLTRLLNSLGARETPPPLQVFLTTHSPVAVRELNGNQLFVVRGHPTAHHLVLPVGIADDIQSTVRADPEAFLARSVIVCEGASEVGLIRGLDHYWTALNGNSMLSAGTTFVNVGGGEPDRCFVRGLALRRLGYRVLVLVDADKPPTPATVEVFEAAGGEYLTWRAGRALEDELFMSLPDAGVDALLQRGIELMEEELVAAHIQTQSNGQVTLAHIRQQRQQNGAPYPPETRQLLGLTARNRRHGWFKSVTRYENVAHDILGPHLPASDAGFQALINRLYGWAHAA